MSRIAVPIAVIILAAALGVLFAERSLLRQSGIVSPSKNANISGEWRGYLIVPDEARYRIVAAVDGDVWLSLDGRQVIDASMKRREAWIDLRRGLHSLHIRHPNSVGWRAFDLRWSQGKETPLRISPVLFVPDLVPSQEIQQRILIARLAPFALPACSLLLLAAAAITLTIVVRKLFAGYVEPLMRSSLLVAALIAVLATGMWWGLPDDNGWAVDEITPGGLSAAVESRFGNGWATIYPPFHYIVLTALTAPFHLAAEVGVRDLTDIRVATQMFLIARGLSVLMGAGIILVAFGLAREIAGTRAAFFSAATITTALPLAYYAKTVNVDVPSMFWLTFSLLFYSRAFAYRRPADFYLFTATGVAAICTKDQTYGYFILPAAYMTAAAIVRRNAPPPGVPPVRVLAGMAAIALGGLVLLYNVPFNASGFVEHLRIITGPNSQNFRMFPPTPSGQVRLLVTTLWELGQAIGWPLYAASICGVVAAVRARVQSIRWLLLPVVSYYLTLIAVVGYQYDRFLVGTIVVLAVAAGWWMDRWTRDGAQWRQLKTAAVSVAIVYGVARVVALDAMMLKDSRYDVENWLIENASPHHSIAATGFSVYLPRAAKVFWNPIEPQLQALETEKPDFVVVNTAFSMRGEPGSKSRLFYDALTSGQAGYERVLKNRTHLPWSPLNWELRFKGDGEDEFSNLAKINPAIEVFQKIQSKSRELTLSVLERLTATPTPSRPIVRPGAIRPTM